MRTNGPQGPRPGSVRTCAGCRERDGRERLLRLVAAPEPGRVLADVRRRLPGRGVSVHYDPACLVRALRRGGLARGLRRPVSMAPGELCSEVATALRRRVDGLLVTARRSGRVAIGTDAVREALAAGRPALVLFAADAANRRERIEREAREAGVPVVVHGGRASVGALLGRAEVGVLAVEDERIAGLLRQAVVAAEAFEAAAAEHETRTMRGRVPQGHGRGMDKTGGRKRPHRSEGP